MTLTVPEAARRLGRNPETIRRWIREGKLPSRKVGTQHLIEERDLESVIAPETDRLPLPVAWRTTFWGEPMPDWVRRSPGQPGSALTPVVLDAGAALHLLALPDTGLASELILRAPRLLRSEVLSALHVHVRRGAVPVDAAHTMLRRLDALSISLFADERLLHERTWAIADQLGWAKTYDAEYVALAQILALPLLTTDGRLARGVEHIVKVIGPAEL